MLPLFGLTVRLNLESGDGSVACLFNSSCNVNTSKFQSVTKGIREETLRSCCTPTAVDYDQSLTTVFFVSTHLYDGV